MSITDILTMASQATMGQWLEIKESRPFKYEKPDQTTAFAVAFRAEMTDEEKGRFDDLASFQQGFAVLTWRGIRLNMPRVKRELRNGQEIESLITLRRKNQELEKTNAVLDKLVHEQREALTKTSEELKEAQKSKDALHDDNCDLRKKLAVAESNLKRLEREFLALQTASNEVSAENDRIREDLRSAERKERDLGDLQQQKTILVAENEELRVQLLSTQQNLSREKMARLSLEEANRELHEENRTLQERPLLKNRPRPS